MENILIGTTVTDLTANTIDDLVAGDLALLLHGDLGTTPLLRGSEVTNAEIAAARGIQFLLKRADGELESSLIISDRDIINKNYQAYVAGTPGVFKLGDNAAVETALTIPTTGEGTIRLIDLVEPYQVDNFPAIITATKKSTETVLQYLTKVVAQINADPIAKLLVVAALETNTGRYQIKLTTLNSKIKLGVATSDIFEGYTPITVTARVIAKGTGEQIQEIEKELSVFKGNGNYMENGDLYYKDGLKSSLGTNYNTMSMTWKKEVSPSISTNIFVASPNVLICVPSGDSTLSALYAKFVGPVQVEE